MKNEGYISTKKKKKKEWGIYAFFARNIYGLCYYLWLKCMTPRFMFNSLKWKKNSIIYDLSNVRFL